MKNKTGKNNENKKETMKLSFWYSMLVWFLKQTTQMDDEQPTRAVFMTTV